MISIKRLIKLRGFTVKDLAEEINVNYPHLSTLINRNKQIPWNILVDIAKKINVPVNVLLYYQYAGVKLYSEKDLDCFIEDLQSVVSKYKAS